MRPSTFGLLVEAIPLHFATTYITADKVSPVAQKHSVADSIDVGWGEICNAGVAGVLAVGWWFRAHQLLPDLQPC